MKKSDLEAIVKSFLPSLAAKLWNMKMFLRDVSSNISGHGDCYGFNHRSTTREVDICYQSWYLPLSKIMGKTEMWMCLNDLFNHKERNVKWNCLSRCYCLPSQEVKCLKGDYLMSLMDCQDYPPEDAGKQMFINSIYFAKVLYGPD